MNKETNYDVLLTLSAEQFAHVFHKLQLDGATESEWVEWMHEPANKEHWKEILS